MHVASTLGWSQFRVDLSWALRRPTLAMACALASCSIIKPIGPAPYIRILAPSDGFSKSKAWRAQDKGSIKLASLGVIFSGSTIAFAAGTAMYFGGGTCHIDDTMPLSSSHRLFRPRRQ